MSAGSGASSPSAARSFRAGSPGVARGTSGSSPTRSSRRASSRSCPTWRRTETPPMKIILLDDIPKLGRRGEVRDVADGFARNFLLPKKLALSATAGNLKNLDHIRKQQDAKAGRIKSDADTLRERIEALTYTEQRQASEEGK